MAKKQTISIDFANPTGLAAWPVRLGLCVIGLASMAMLFMQIQQTRGEINRHARVVIASELTQQKRVDPKLNDAWKNAQTIQTQLQMPWLEMLNHLTEIKAQYPEISLVRLTPNVEKNIEKGIVIGEVTLLLEANNLAEILSFLAALNQDKNFQAATLQSQQKSENSAERKQLFTLQFQWPTAIARAN